jgi:hypothetical protein
MAMRVLIAMDNVNLHRQRIAQEKDTGKEEKRLAVERQREFLNSLPPELREELFRITLLDTPTPPALLEKETAPR